MANSGTSHLYFTLQSKAYHQLPHHHPHGHFPCEGIRYQRQGRTGVMCRRHRHTKLSRHSFSRLSRPMARRSKRGWHGSTSNCRRLCIRRHHPSICSSSSTISSTRRGRRGDGIRCYHLRSCTSCHSCHMLRISRAHSPPNWQVLRGHTWHRPTQWGALRHALPGADSLDVGSPLGAKSSLWAVGCRLWVVEFLSWAPPLYLVTRATPPPTQWPTPPSAHPPVLLRMRPRHVVVQPRRKCRCR
jgi:hypothetical protein